MEESLKHIKGPIIVTGCQRSGTTIMTKIVCKDLGYSFHQDDEYPNNIIGINRIKLLINCGITNIAIQSPIILYTYPDFYYSIPGIHFIGMKRDKKDILDSMERINWMHQVQHIYTDMYSYWNTHIDHMNSMWESLKATLPESAWTEVEYQSLMSHPLYIQKKYRLNFTDRQTKLYGKKY